MAGKRISLMTKLLSGFIVIVVFFSFAAVYNNSMLKSINELYEDQQKRAADVRRAMELKRYLETLYGIQAELIINNNAMSIDRYETARKDFQELLAQVAAQADTEEEKRLSGDLTVLCDSYIKKFDEVKDVFNNRSTYSPDRLSREYSRLGAESDQIRTRAITFANEIIDLNDKEALAAQEKFAAGISKTVLVSYTSLIITAIIGIILALLLSRMVTRPVKYMLERANAIAGGDLTRRLNVRTGDEIGELAEAFNNMTGQMRELVKRIAEKANIVAESAGQLNINSRQTSANATETAATMGQISVTVENASNSAQTAASAALHASGTADEGLTAMQKVKSQVLAVSSESSRVAGIIDELSGSSTEIGSIVDVIKSIADQTNLLALNAAIEAARAGDQGRGFAVVAEEVRKLAEQSAQATGEIYNLINRIQVKTREVSGAMEAGKNEVEKSIEVVNETGEVFGEIITDIKDVTAKIQDIASAAREVASGVQNVAASTQEQTAAVEEVSASSEILSGLSGELKELVGRFKV
ncbi:MAG TPA: methyl-accepting chemotaxis protein [Desulfotomaculum sp.]|nr:methyl-accepting chemotaxis protein [Desulfotomaculum sp.]